MKNIHLLYSLFGLLLFSSCATMYKGTRSIIHLDSPIPNTNVFVNKDYIGTTPLAIKVKKGIRRKRVLMQSPGYKDSTFVLKREFDPISLLSTSNIWIDILTGAVLDYSNNNYYINLEPTQKSDNINLLKRSPFYIIKNTGDTIFTTPFHKYEYGRPRKYVARVNFNSLDGRQEAIGASYIKKAKSLKIDNTYIWALLLTTRINTNIKYLTFLNVIYYQDKNYNYSILMQELLENGKYHLVKSYFDHNFVRNDGSFILAANPIYYLYEDGKALESVSNENLINILNLRFGNEKELIQALQGKCTFKKLEKQLNKKFKPKKV